MAAENVLSIVGAATTTTAVDDDCRRILTRAGRAAVARVRDQSVCVCPPKCVFAVVVVTVVLVVSCTFLACPCRTIARASRRWRSKTIIVVGTTATGTAISPATRSPNFFSNQSTRVPLPAALYPFVIRSGSSRNIFVCAVMASVGHSKVFILDKYFTELQKFWETEIKLQGNASRIRVMIGRTYDWYHVHCTSSIAGNPNCCK